jgi:hypothetical protein
MTSNPSHLKVSPQSPAYSEASIVHELQLGFDHVSQLCRQTFANNKIVAAFTRTQ